MVTIKDVALEANVTIGTVSRYLNGQTLKEKNHLAVEAAIDKLGYTANTLARSMKTGKSMTVGVVVPNLASMFTMHIIESIEEELDPLGYHVLVAGCNRDEKKQEKKIKALIGKQVDGIILLPTGENAREIKNIVKDVPLVLIDRILDEPLFDSVTINNEQVTYKRLKKALGKEVEVIGIIKSPQVFSTAKERYKGYQSVVEETKGIKSIEVQGGYTWESGYQAMKTLIESHVELVFASNYDLTVGAINAIKESKKEIRLLGFDTLEESIYKESELYEFISQPVEKIGKEAAKLLLKRIKDPNKEQENKVLEI
jgi:LacI family transcriptional regulator